METPGGGAAQRAAVIEQQLQRKRELLERTQRDVAALEAALHNWRAGVEGELRTAAVLDALRGEGWLLLHDVLWPGRPQANLDHVAVGPGGVVVVDAKRWAGQVSVAGGKLRCGRWQKTSECQAAARMASDVASLLDPRHRTAVTSALCLVEQPVPATPVEMGVVAVGDAHLADHLRSLPRRFDDDDVSAVHAQLRGLLAGASSPPVLAAPSAPVLRAVEPLPGARAAAPTRRSNREAAVARSRKPARVKRARQASPQSTWRYALGSLGLLGTVVAGYVTLLHALG